MNTSRGVVYRLDARGSISVPEPGRVWFNESTRRTASHHTLPPLIVLENRPMGLRPILVPLALLVACGFGLAEDWPGWRGPRADGTVSDSGYPLTWSEKQNVKW